MDKDTMICGLCGNCEYYHVHIFDPSFCDIHPEYGELCEKDKCDDYKECD